jgi:pimeloyl-ACP methyl ester carboxylesterase
MFDLPPGASHSIDTYATAVQLLLDELRIDTAIIGGLSMGGYVAFAMFRQEPERFSGIVLADTRPQADTPEGRDGRERMRHLLAREGVRAVADQMLPRLLSAHALQDDDIAGAVRKLIEALPGPAVDAALRAMMTRPDSSSLLPRMSCPALVLVGEQDAVTPPDVASAMQQLLPRSTLTVIPGAGHLSNLEAPDAFSRALENFLRAPL